MQPATDAEPCFLASELPPVPDWARKPPKPKEPMLFDLGEEGRESEQRR